MTKQWITPAGERIYWDLKIAAMVSLMFDMPQAQRLPFMTYLTACIMDCSRCCIILQKDSDDGKGRKLVIAAGYPEYEHGLGSEVSPALGKDFLESVIKGGKLVSIEDPKNDPRVTYMKSLITHRSIRSLIFVPLYYKKTKVGTKVEYEEKPFGVMALDYTNKDPEKKFEKDNLEIRGIVKVIVRLILSERRRDSDNSELIRAACSGSLEQHALGIQDAFGNLVTKFPFIEKLNEDISRIKEAVQKAEEHYLIIKEAYDQFDSRANDVLATVRLNPSKLTLQKHDLGIFLKNFVVEKQRGGSKIKIGLDLSKLHHKTVLLDSKKMRECFEMILKNSEESSAKKILTRALSRYGEIDGNRVIITITRDGRQLSTTMKKQLFQLFAAGSGLSVVRSIIEAHHGKIFLKEVLKKVCEEEVRYTRFIIHLPSN